MARGRFITGILTASVVAGCAPDAATRLSGGDPLAPPGVAQRGPSVDPLVVADRLLQAGEYELALGAYHRAAQAQGMTPEIRHAIAGANIRLGRLHQADRDLDVLLAEDPENPRYLNDKAVILMERGEIAEARLTFRKAFALDNGNSAEIRENLRVALAKMENPSYSDEKEDAFTLVRHGNGAYALHDSAETDP